MMALIMSRKEAGEDMSLAEVYPHSDPTGSFAG